MSEMRDAIGVLLAGGQGERLWPLTRDRAKPAVPFGALYRIIDITLSNCINSDLRRVFILTQYKALSLNRHIRAGWSPLMGLGDYIEVLPPQMRVSTAVVPGHGRRGVSEYLFDRQRALEVRVYPVRRSHLQDELRRMLQQHVDAGADVTSRSWRFRSKKRPEQFGVIEVDKDYRIKGFDEKPANPKESPLPRGVLQRVDGHLHFQYPTDDSDLAGGFGGSEVRA